MKHFIRSKLRKLTAASLTFIMAATFAVPFFAYPDWLMADTQDDLDAVNKQLEELRNKQSELNASYGELNEKLSASGEKLSSIEDAVNAKQSEIDATNIQVADMQAEIDQQYAAMKLRIQFMYEHNDYTYVEVLLSSQSMADMLNKFEYINKISEYDRQMLEEYQSTINLISSSKVKLEEDKETLTASQEALQAQVDALEVVQNEKTAQLNALSKNTANQVAYKKQLEADEKKLDAEIASITAKIKAEEASGVTPSNRYDGGTFKWPTTSTRITSPYGDTSDRTSPHKGVDIGAVRAGVSGDPVYAAYDGKVVIAHRQSEYYSTAGNYVMIYHGNGLYTRYLHLDSLNVSVGAQVTKGQKLGVMGNTGNSFGAHLHFDVMLNGSYVNPMPYFK